MAETGFEQKSLLCKLDTLARTLHWLYTMLALLEVIQVSQFSSDESRAFIQLHKAEEQLQEEKAYSHS